MTDTTRAASTPTLPPEDLLKDPLLTGLPRDPAGRPMLGGIPLLRCIGRGGMGCVYFAVHPRLQVDVAVKVLPFHLAQRDASIAARFLSEARMAAALASDHLVRVLDVNVEGATHYLVMEYVNGETAGARLKRIKTAYTERDALDVVIAATRGLAAAHEKGIIHRDIKPDNIIIPHGELSKAKLADLGLAKPESGRADAVETMPDVAMGTPGFMAPEQAENARSAGPTADVFSVGATLFALLTMRPPFQGASVIATLRDTIEKPAPPAPSNVSAALRAVIDKCLQKNPKDRYANAKDLLTALLALRKKPAEAPRSQALVYIAAAAASMIVVIVAVVALRKGPPPVPPPPDTSKRAAFDEYWRAADVALTLAHARDDAAAWSAVAEAAGKAESVAPGPAETTKARELAADARRHVEAIRQRTEQRYADLMKSGQAAKFPMEAIRAYQDALAIKPGDEAATKAIARVQESMRKDDPKRYTLKFAPHTGDRLVGRSESHSTTKGARQTTHRRDSGSAVTTYVLVNNTRLTKKTVEIPELTTETWIDTGRPTKTISPLQGRKITISMKDGKLVHEGAEGLDEKFLKNLRLDDDQTFYLPRRPVALGDSWEVDPSEFRGTLMVRFNVLDLPSGKVLLTLKEVKEIDHRMCAVIGTSLELRTKAIEFRMAGELIIWLDRGYVLSNKAAGTTKMNMPGENDMESQISVEEIVTVKE